MEFSRGDIRKLIYYNWKRGLNPPAISIEICEILGDNIVTPRNCQNWVKKSNEGGYSVEEKTREGRPSVELLDDRIQEILTENNHATTREMANILNVSQPTIYRHLTSMGNQYMACR